MKTAMQELIEYLDKVYYVKEIIDWDKYKKEYFEKEKEQIINAMNYSTYREMKGINVSNEEYYNQTYNK